jgi:hypothetical protein
MLGFGEVLERKMSKQRKYSLDEIDAMRMSVIILAGGDVYVSETTIEDRLRTYMLGGVSPEELQAKVDARDKAQPIVMRGGSSEPIFLTPVGRS